MPSLLREGAPARTQGRPGGHDVVHEQDGRTGRRQGRGAHPQPSGEVRRTRRGVEPDRVARPPAQGERRRDAQPRIGTRQLPAEPQHVVAAARPGGGRARRRGDEPPPAARGAGRRADPGDGLADGLADGPGEQAGQRHGEVAPPRSL